MPKVVSTAELDQIAELVCCEYPADLPYSLRENTYH